MLDLNHNYGQGVKQGGMEMAKKDKINFRFINPNTPERTSDYIIKVLLEANLDKLNDVIQNQSRDSWSEDGIKESHSN